MSHGEEIVFEKDQQKEEYLKQLGIIVKRYPDDQVCKDIENILLDIEHICTQLASTSATPPTPSWKEGEKQKTIRESYLNKQ